MRHTRGGRHIDVARLREAVKGHGIDPRYWVSYGTVAVAKDDGTLDFSDPAAVHIAPDGVICDVVLHPWQLHVTCRYTGSQGGPHAQIISPIHPGDEVLVALPSGNANGMPVVVSVLNNEFHRVPLGTDLKPIFQNDRVLVFADGVPVDLRTSAGQRVLLDPGGEVQVTADKVSTIAGDVRLGSTGAGHPVIKGDTFQDGLGTLLTALNTFAGTCVTIPPTVPATALTAAITAFKTLLNTTLSGTTKTD